MSCDFATKIVEWGEERKMSVKRKKSKERTRKRTSSGVEKTRPPKELEKYIEGWSDAATLDADSYAYLFFSDVVANKIRVKPLEKTADLSRRMNVLLSRWELEKSRVEE